MSFSISAQAARSSLVAMRGVTQPDTSPTATIEIEIVRIIACSFSFS